MSEHTPHDGDSHDRLVGNPGPGESVEPRPKPSPHAGWRQFHTGVLVGAIVAVAVTLLIVQNGHSIRINWLVFTFQSPAWIVLFVTAAAGAVVWDVARATFRRRRHRHVVGKRDSEHG